MRLLVLSDLHVDHLQNKPRVQALADQLAAQKADAFVLAGDISHKLSEVEDVLARFARLECPKLFVPGNHDVWIVREGREPVQTSWDKLRALEDICRRHGFVFLETQNESVLGFTFVGSIGWYDYSYASPDLAFSAEQYRDKRWNDLTYMDRDYARWGMSDPDVLQNLLGGLRERLRQAPEPRIFVSHHVPRRQWVLRRGHPSWDFFNAYMGSAALEALLEEEGVQRFVFGHTHRPMSLVEPARFVINNPLGYPRQALTPIQRAFHVT